MDMRQVGPRSAKRPDRLCIIGEVLDEAYKRIMQPCGRADR